MRPIVSIISPAHNEELVIVDFVTKAIFYLKKNKIAGDVVIIENGSTDQTLPLLQKLVKKYSNLRIISLPRGDKGIALKSGLKAAKGDYLVTLDTDLWDPDFVKNSILLLKEYDVVVGSKSLPGASDNRPFLSRLYNIGYNFLFRLFFNFQGTETHAKLSFRKTKILPLVDKCQTADLVFDTELILLAERHNLSKIEIPVSVAEIRPRRFKLIPQLGRTIKHFLLLIKVLGPSPNWHYLGLFVALLIGLFLRFYDYPNRFFFSVDEEHYAYMSRMISVDGHFPAIGGPISGTKLYMAPWFLYFNALWLFLSKGNPFFAGAVLTLIEWFVIIFVYLIGSRLFNKNVGLVATLLYASSPAVAIFDRHYWNITLVPFISVVSFYGLLRYADGHRRWLFVISLIIAFGLSTTFSVFAIFLFALISILFLRKKTLLKDLAIFLGIVIVAHIPLLVFELRHDFWLVRGLVEYLTAGHFVSDPLPVRLLNTLNLFVGTISKSIVLTTPIDLSDETSICPVNVMRYSPPVWATLVSLLALAVFLVQLVARKVNFKYAALIIILFVVNFLSLFVFRSDQGERHWLSFLPLFFVLLGVFFVGISKLGKTAKILTPLLLTGVIGLNLISFINSYASFPLSAKLEAVRFIAANTKPDEFYLDSVGECHIWGYRYLFSYVGHEPAASFLDPEFSWMYSRPPVPNQATVRATVISPNQNPKPINLEVIREELRMNAFKTNQFGNIEVYLNHVR